MADESTGNKTTGDRTTHNRAAAAGSAAPESITAVLHDGEHLLWWGKPRRTAALRPWMLSGIAEGILWTVLGGVMLATSLRPGSSNLLWGIILLAGLFRLIVRPLLQLHKRAHTVYAVTNQRVIASPDGGHRRKVHSIGLGSLPVTAVKRHNDGSGTISFQHPPRWVATGRVHHPLSRFDSIEDPDAVYATLTDAFAEFSPAPHLPPPPAPNRAQSSIIR